MPAPTLPVPLPPVRVHALDALPLSIPLVEPFVIATGQLDTTRAALVSATLALVDQPPRRATGLGEAAALPPVTHEDQPELLAAVVAAAPALVGRELSDLAALGPLLDAAIPGSPVARGAVEAALLDAWARLAGLPLARLLGGPAELPALVTDVTLPIGEPAHLAELARSWHANGFSCFKVKVGRDWHADLASLRAAHAAVPAARFRLDANAGFPAADALALLDAALAAGLVVECFEQPCARDDLAGMAEVCARSPVPIVADESCRSLADVHRLVDARAAHAVNLKLVKLGGPLPALAVGRAARAAGLRLMAGAMVETRLGLVTMAHVVAALGGVDWVDLDTAFLLAEERFTGGWVTHGPRLDLAVTPGHGVHIVP